MTDSLKSNRETAGYAREPVPRRFAKPEVSSAETYIADFLRSNSESIDHTMGAPLGRTMSLASLFVIAIASDSDYDCITAERPLSVPDKEGQVQSSRVVGMMIDKLLL